MAIDLANLPNKTALTLAGTDQIFVNSAGVASDVSVSALTAYVGAAVQPAIDAVESDLAAPSGASLVGYMPEGAGAVDTTVQSKLRESVSVLDFYANGVSGERVDPTGVIDSTLGFQAALNAALSVYAPDGAYKTGRLVPREGARLYGSKKTFFAMSSDVSLFDTTDIKFKFNNITVVLEATHTATVIKFLMQDGRAYQSNDVDFSGTNIRGNNADCVGIHFKASNNSYLAYNNMSDLAVTHEGTKKAAILFEVDGSAAFIQGNTFGNCNLIRGGIQYICNGVLNDSTRMIGNYFDGTYQTKSGYNFQLSGINNAYLWDSEGMGNIRFHKGSVGTVGGLGAYELIGGDQWSILSPAISVIDGWGMRVQKYSVLATNVTAGTLTAKSKAQRGLVTLHDPCVNLLDPRFTLTGLTQTPEIVSIGDLRRSCIKLTNTATLAATAEVKLPFSACTLSKFPEFKIGFRKRINGYYGAGTPVEWNERCNVDIGLISDDGTNGLFMRLGAVGGHIENSAISLIHKVGGVETVLNSALLLKTDETCYFSLYVDDLNVYMKATRTGYDMIAGALIAENVNYGTTTGWVSVARSALFNVNTVTLNPTFKLTSADKEVGRAIYRVFGIEFQCTEM